MAACSVGVMTEPDCLGPCEPGTGVLLETVIWHESNSGMLVVNVSWKGKKYVGTLLDSSVHEWAPPRPDSPSRQQEAESMNASPQKRKNRRGRGGRRNPPAPVAAPCIPRTWGGDFKPHRSTLQELANEMRPEKRARCDIECPEQKCNKKFRCQNALEYHRIHAHVQNEIDASTPSKARSAAKQTRGIQTQTCSEELQHKPAALTHATKPTCTLAQTMTSQQDNKVTQSSVVPMETSQSTDNSAKVIESSTMNTAKANNLAGLSVASVVGSIANSSTSQPGKVLQTFAAPKMSPISGTVRPVLSTKPDAKKGGAPIAVLRPLVPQHVSKMSADKTIASLTTPTHTLTISSSQPEYRGVRSSQGATSTAIITSSAVSKPTVAGAVLPQASPNMRLMANAGAQQRGHKEGGKFSTPGGGGDLHKPRTPPSGSAVTHRRDSGKSSHRGSRSNSMVSPNYSDISDASDGDMDTSQGEMPPPRLNGEVGTEETRDGPTAEERLYCNEELPSPSNTPGEKETDGPVSPVKNISTHNTQASPAPSGPGEAARQSVPLHAVPPPQHIMYPYFPFMPNSQLNSAPMSAGAPLYAPPPYFMTYQGFPVMPAQGHPSMPQQMAPGQAFVSVSGANGTAAPTQVPKSKPN